MRSIHDPHALEAFRRSHRIDPYRIQRLRAAYYKNHHPAARAVDELPEEARAAATDSLAFHCLTLEAAHESSRDAATRLLFRTADDHRIESVILRIRSGRTALCISSQVGCGVGCSFCATGRLGARRNLTSDEILDQVVQANLRLRGEQRSVRNIVFMGMGEPLHNQTAVERALTVLTDPACFHHTPRRICVSTVGVPDGMVGLARRFPRLRIALSLHSARPEVRARLVPLARHHSLAELRTAVTEVTTIQGGQAVMIEYLLLEGINDGAEDLDALRAWVGELPVHVNLIPYNPIPDADGLCSPPRAAREAFGRALRESGLKVTLRYSQGGDIAAACGQLARANPA